MADEVSCGSVLSLFSLRFALIVFLSPSEEEELPVEQPTSTIETDWTAAEEFTKELQRVDWSQHLPESFDIDATTEAFHSYFNTLTDKYFLIKWSKIWSTDDPWIDQGDKRQDCYSEIRFQKGGQQWRMEASKENNRRYDSSPEKEILW